MLVGTRKTLRSLRTALALVVGLVATLLVPAAATADRSSADVAEAVATALAHVEARAGELGLSADDIAELQVTDAYRSAHNGATHVYLRQSIGGLEVADTNLTITLDRAGRVAHMAESRLLAGLAQRTSGTAALSAADAVAAGARALGVAEAASIRVVQAEEAGARRTVLSLAGVAQQPVPARLVYQPTSDGRIRLAWNFELDELARQHWWNASVDAETGALLASHDLVTHDTKEANAAAIARQAAKAAAPALASQLQAREAAETVSEAADGAKYRVYALPLESPNDGPRTLVVNPADELASPFGWHDTNGQAGPEFTRTEGNNVHAYSDATNTATTGVVLPGLDADGGAGLNFDFPLDLNQPPAAYKDAAVTNLFYWNNIIHDVFYRYGFDEPAGNFQVNNYGRGGAGNDSVRAEAQDGSGVNNANFATPADGSRPRMQMYVWPSTNTSRLGQIRDGDLDAGIIVHEYGHGISNRLTGGPSNVGCLGNQEQMGEGWSDWLAIALTAREGDTGEELRGMGTYALYSDSRQAKGIRPTAYSTDMTKNPATYDTIKTAAVPHGVGYVWSTILWDVYWALVDQHGFEADVYDTWEAGGNNLAIQLVMDGMKMQPCRPGFVDGRDAIIAADAVLTQGENTCTLWNAFARRGLGFSAQQGASTSRADNTQAFDTHPDCV